MEAEEAELRGIFQRGLPGSEIVTYRRLNGGVSARATFVELELPEGTRKRVVVRRPGYDADAVVQRERAVLARCASLGISSPTPCFADRDTAAIVLDYIDGAPDFAPSNLPDMLEQMAAQLLRIHSVPVDAHLAMLQPRKMSAARQVTAQSAQPDAALNEPELRRIVSSLWPWPQPNPDALLHGDYWPGNLLFQQGKLAAVLDWEEAEIGDPLSDIALARLDLVWAFGNEAAETFTAHYRRLSDIDWTHLAHWDLCVALRPLGQLPRWAAAYHATPISRPDITPGSMAEGHRQFVAHALARL
jgi:aminoglycoside phosphotransferase (APT) family kinase protein